MNPALGVSYTAKVATPSGPVTKHGTFYVYPINWASLDGAAKIEWWRKKVVRDGLASNESSVVGVRIQA